MAGWLWSCCGLAFAAVVVVISGFAHAMRPYIEDIRAGEGLSDAADHAWQRAFNYEEVSSLRDALADYERVLELDTLRAPGNASIARSFASWLVRPLRLRCMRRIAAGHELLRESLPQIVQAHEALLSMEYCTAVQQEASVFFSEWEPSFDYSSCLAPHARGTILFAANPADADAAFERAKRMTRPDGQAALSWTTRWQLPDIHVVGLVALPWWPLHPAVAQLETLFPVLLAEFEHVRSSGPAAPATGQPPLVQPVLALQADSAPSR